MRVVLDSNVLLSALISPHAPPHLIYTAWRKGRFELISCSYQIEEIRRASRYPRLQRILQGHRVGAMINHLQETTLVDLPAQTETAVRDPHDAFLLALAEAGHADALVTGDQSAGLLELGSHNRARIVTPTRFCTELLHIRSAPPRQQP